MVNVELCLPDSNHHHFALSQYDWELLHFLDLLSIFLFYLLVFFFVGLFLWWILELFGLYVVVVLT